MGDFLDLLPQIGKAALTAAFSLAAMFLVAKLIGHRQISQLGVFDYINGITVGSIAAELATEIEEPWRPLTALIIYGLAVWLLSIILSKFPRSRKYINGTPTIILNDGRLYRDNMKKAKLDLSEFMVLCRQAGYFDLGDIQTAVFEHNGMLTILPAANRRPINPDDMGLVPERAEILTEIIMDGRIMQENLKRRGLDEAWLNKNLTAQGYKSPREVFLAVCDKQNNLSVYPNN